MCLSKCLKITKWMDLVAYWPVVTMMMLFASLPFGFSHFQRWSLILFAAGYLVDLLVFSRWKGWKWSKEKIPYLFCVLFFLLMPLWRLFEGDVNPNYYLRCIEQRLPFVAFGVIGIIGLNDRFRIRYFALVAMLTTIVMVACSVYGFYYGVGELFYVPDITFKENVEAYACWTSLTVNAHMTYNLFINLTIIFIFFLWQSNDVARWQIRLSYLTLFLAIPSEFLTLGRCGMITTLLLFAFYFGYFKWKMRNPLLISSLVGLTVIAMLLLPVVIHRDSLNNPRTSIWKLSAQIISEKPLLGYGVSAAREKLIHDGLEDDDFYNNYAITYIEGHPIYDTEGNVDLTRMHPHNMFLGTAMEFGLLGIVVLCGCLISPFYCFKGGRKRLFLCMSLFAFFLQGLFESIGPHLLPTLLMLELLLGHYSAEERLDGSSLDGVGRTRNETDQLFES